MSRVASERSERTMSTVPFERSEFALTESPTKEASS
jgi:hypothetical protein